MTAPSKFPDSSISSVARLTLNAAKSFKEDYIDLSRALFEREDVRNGLHHAGEFGRFRERLLQTFLSQFLPSRLCVGDGFVVDTFGDKSTQCDVLLFDRDTNPRLATAGGLVMIPIEVCAAVGEAKSKLTLAQAKEALVKLSTIKKMRADMKVSGLPTAPIEELLWARDVHQQAIENSAFLYHVNPQQLYSPSTIERQNLVTFLVCEEIAWPEGCDPADESNPRFLDALHELHNVQPKGYLRHNFILSLKQGFLSYFFALKARNHDDEPRRIPYPYPVQSIHRIEGTEHDGLPTDCGIRWLPADNHHRHVMLFASELVRVASQVPIYPFTPQDHSQDPAAYEFIYFPGP